MKPDLDFLEDVLLITVFCITSSVVTKVLLGI
jgi:hypothetical protein